MPQTLTRPRAAAAKARSPADRPDPCADPCPPRCPSCGGLECLCRPRFFPGQLLTDRDLNALTRYIVEKNKLHNRYLHGWGVACGLEVTCDPCDPQQVIVRTGYALSPCGDDIVVCKDHAVNLCELIDQCRPANATVCDPPYERPPRDCRGGNTDWVLAICYDEKPSRGLTAQLGAADSACKNPCRCGGSASCSRCGGSGCGGGSGCSCGGKGGGACAPYPASYSSRPQAAVRKECEPTQICESYRFIAYPAPKRSGLTPFPDIGHETAGSLFGKFLGWAFENRTDLGELIERVLCCIARAHELLGEWKQGQKKDGQALYTAYLQYAESMQAFATEFTVHRCNFVGKVGMLYDKALAFQQQVGNGANLANEQVAHLKGQLDQLDNALFEMIVECACAALLPPCPEPVEGNCVPLAVVKVRAGQCTVQEICNWQARKILITWRTVGYWLSWLPWHCLQEQIAKLCCGKGDTPKVLQLLAMLLGVALLGATCGEDPKQVDKDAAQEDIGMVGGGFEHDPKWHHIVRAAQMQAKPKVPPVGDPRSAAAAPDLMMHLFEDFDRGRSGVAAAPSWFKLAARLMDGSLIDDAAAVGGEGGLAQMRQEVQALSQVVIEQQKQIDALRGMLPQG